MKTPSPKQLTSLDTFIDAEYGAKGTKRRNQFEEDYKAFKLGILIKQKRMEKGMTQEELAQKIGANKGYISRIENNTKDIRFSTLQKIVEVGLEGELELFIKI